MRFKGRDGDHASFLFWSDKSRKSKMGDKVMANVNLTCRVTENEGVEHHSFRHETTDIGVDQSEMTFSAPAGETTMLKWWMWGNPGGSIKVEVLQGDRVIKTRLKSDIPNSVPTGWDKLSIIPELEA